MFEQGEIIMIDAASRRRLHEEQEREVDQQHIWLLFSSFSKVILTRDLDLRDTDRVGGSFGDRWRKANKHMQGVISICCFQLIKVNTFIKAISDVKTRGSIVIWRSTRKLSRCFCLFLMLSTFSYASVTRFISVVNIAEQIQYFLEDYFYYLSLSLSCAYRLSSFCLIH